MPHNPFESLEVEGEEKDTSVTKPPQEAPKVLKPTQQTQAPASKPAAKDSQPKPAKPVGDKPAAPRNVPPRQRKPQQAVSGAGDAPNTSDEPFEKPKGDHVRPRHDGRGGTRQGFSARNERRSHRPFSGNEKKEGHGLGNWGNVKEEISEEAKVAVGANDETATAPAAPAAEEGAVEQAKDEEPKTLSLDEYKRQQQSKRAGGPSLPTARKPGEGEDDAKWGDAQELVKQGEDDAEDKALGDRKAQRAFKKQTVPIDVQFAGDGAERRESREGREGREGGFRGGRGGRGGSRGGRGNSNAGRGPRGNAPAGGAAEKPFSLEADFPKL